MMKKYYSTESRHYSGFAQKPPSDQENQKQGNCLHVTLVRRQLSKWNIHCLIYKMLLKY